MGAFLTATQRTRQPVRPHSTANGAKQTDPQAGTTLHKTYSQYHNYKKKRQTLTCLVKLKQKTRDTHLLKWLLYLEEEEKPGSVRNGVTADRKPSPRTAYFSEKGLVHVSIHVCALRRVLMHMCSGSSPSASWVLGTELRRAGVMARPSVVGSDCLSISSSFLCNSGDSAY